MVAEQLDPAPPQVLVAEVGRQVVDDLDDGHVGVQLGEPRGAQVTRARRHAAALLLTNTTRRSQRSAARSIRNECPRCGGSKRPMTRPVGRGHVSAAADEHRAEELVGDRAPTPSARPVQPVGSLGRVGLGGDPAGEVDDGDLTGVAGRDLAQGVGVAGVARRVEQVPLVVAVGDVRDRAARPTARRSRPRRGTWSVASSYAATSRRRSVDPPGRASPRRRPTSAARCRPASPGRARRRVAATTGWPTTSARTFAARGERTSPSGSLCHAPVRDEPAAGLGQRHDVDEVGVLVVEDLEALRRVAIAVESPTTRTRTGRDGGDGRERRHGAAPAPPAAVRRQRRSRPTDRAGDCRRRCAATR